MPSCSIITCRTRSYPNCGIGFYRFPHKPRIREKWIEVTGRKDWIPTKNCTICSKHFAEDDFLVIKQKDRNRLRSDAVPHIDVCRLVQNDIDDKLKHAKSNGASKKQIKVVQDESDDDDDEEESSSEDKEDDERTSPSLSGESKKRLIRIINTKNEVIKRQKAIICALRSQKSRSKAKIEKMEEVMNDLQKEILKWLPE